MATGIGPYREPSWGCLESRRYTPGRDHSLSRYQISPFFASVEIRSEARNASACTVSVGWPRPLVTKLDPSHKKRLGTSCVRWSESTTDVFASPPCGKCRGDDSQGSARPPGKTRAARRPRSRGFPWPSGSCISRPGARRSRFLLRGLLVVVAERRRVVKIVFEADELPTDFIFIATVGWITEKPNEHVGP